MIDYESREYAQRKLPVLREFVHRERALYHKHNGVGMTVTPEILDQLKRDIAHLEELYPDLITADSPTQIVQTDITDDAI